MRMQAIKQLAKISLISANPHLVEKKRATSSYPPYMAILLQNSLMLFIFFLLYSFIFFFIDFTQYPGMFTTYIVMFIVMAVLQGFYLIYNLFYESKDLIHYLPLPFTGSEVFTAKLAVLALLMLPYLIPVLSLFLLLGQDAGQPILITIIISFFLFLLLIVVIIFFSVILVHLITKLAVFRKNKQAVTTTLYTLSSLGMTAVILFISSMDQEADIPYGQVLPDYRVILFVQSFHQVLLNPLSLNAWFGIFLWVALLAILALIVFKSAVPGFYREEELDVRARQKKAKNQQKDHSTGLEKPLISVNRTLWKYNFGLIQEGTLIMQHLSSSIVFPVIILLGPIFTNGIYLGDMTLQYWALFFFAGFAYASLTLSATSIIGVIISLDRENFMYLKSLPFSMKNYLKQKFLFAFIVETLIPLILGIVFIFIAKLPLLLGVLFLAGLIIGIFLLCHHYFARDFRLLYLEWQNLTELFNRGGVFIQFVSLFSSLIIGLISILLINYFLNNLTPIWQTIVSVLTAAIPILACVSTVKWYNKRFWSHLSD